MEFWNQVYFNNTLGSYFVVGGIMLVVVIIKRYLSRYLARLFYQLVKRFWKNVNKESFVGLVVDPLKWFLFILVSVFAIDKLNLPDALDVTLYGHTTADILSRTGNGIIIVSFIWVVLRMVDFIAVVLEEKANQTEDTRDNQLIVFFRDFLKVIIAFIGFLLIVRACFNQPIGSVLTGLSIVGAAIALGAKESLENLIASFIIFFDKPFFAGDIVKVNNVIGQVEKIGLRSTRIRTGDKTLVTVPNKQMVDSVVDNWSLRTQRRAEIKLELASSTPQSTLQLLMELLQRLAMEYSEQISSSNVFFKDFSKSGILISFEYFTPAISLEEYDALKQAINLRIKHFFEEHDVRFAMEGTSIILNNGNG